jgi:shikimate dehydrogenase
VLSGWKTLKGKDYIVFQSTSVGMFPKTEGCIMDEDAFYGKCSAGIDLVYTPSETVFLKKMKAAGAKTLSGLHMLVYQGVLSWELWNLGTKVPEKVIGEVYETVRKELHRRESGNS